MSTLFKKISGGIKFNLKHKILNISLFSAASGSILLFIANCLLNTGKNVLFFNGFSFIFFSISYFISYQCKKKYDLIFNIVIINIVLLILPGSWFVSAGSGGSTSYFVFIIAISIYTLANIKIRKYLLLMLIFVVIILIYSEYQYPYLIISYKNSMVKYLSISIYFITVLVATIFLLKIYNLEYAKINKHLNEKNIILKCSIEKTSKQQKIIKNQNDELLKKNNELKSIIETKDKFYSIIAHDIKNSFNGLLGFSEIINTNASNKKNCKKIEKYSNYLYNNTKDTYNLLVNLLDWSRNEIREIKYKPEKIYLNEFVDNITSFFKYPALSKNVTFVNKITNCTIYADKKMLAAIIRNLISNSLKYTENNKIKIYNKKEKNYYRIYIEDKGTGMSEEQIKNIYSEENIMKGTKGETGSGIGLKLCKDFILRNKGKLFIESEIGKGSIFSFTVPAYENSIKSNILVRKK